MRNLSKLLLILGGWLASSGALAQTESTLYFMNSLPQVMDVNPAIMPRYKLSIGLPGISSFGGAYANNGFTYNDMTTRVNGVLQADLSKLTGSLAQRNYITTSANVDIFRFGLRITPKVYVMLNSTVKAYNRTMLEKGFVSLFVDGTAPIVGSYSNTSSQEEALSYVETGLTMAYRVNEKFTIGGRLKFLKGLANITTDHSNEVIQVSDTYSITATADATVQSSGIQNFSKSGYSLSDNLGDYFRNNGWGLDIGATYKFREKLTFGISLIDIGYINWRNNTYQYTLDPAVATYTFSGVDLNQLVDGNKDYLNAQWDAAKDKFQMKETASSSYTTMLPGKFYLSAKYDLKENLSLGALFFSEKFRDRYSAGMTAALNKNFGKTLTTSVSYTVSNNSYNNLGLGLSVNVSPVQLYIVGDNLLRAPVALITDQNLNPYINSSQLINVRAGLNLVFGWDRGLSRKQSVNDESHNPRANVNDSKVKNTYGRSPEKVKRKKTKNSKGKRNPPASKIKR